MRDLDDGLDESRLIDAIVESIKPLHGRWTEAQRQTGIGAARLQAWTRGVRGPLREPNRSIVLAYAAKMWPDYRERFRARDANPPAAAKSVRKKPNPGKPRKRRHG